MFVLQQTEKARLVSWPRRMRKLFAPDRVSHRVQFSNKKQLHQQHYQSRAWRNDPTLLCLHDKYDKWKEILRKIQLVSFPLQVFCFRMSQPTDSVFLSRSLNQTTPFHARRIAPWLSHGGHG